MTTKTNNPANAPGAGLVPTRVEVYNGSKNHEKYVDWINQMHQKTKIFRDLFNDTFDEVFDSKQSFTHEMFSSLIGDNWGPLENAINNFVSKQNKATKEYFREYYQDALEDTQNAWNEVRSTYQMCRGNQVDGKFFPLHLIDKTKLPFKDGCVDIDVESLNNLAEEFNEYLDKPEDIHFYNLMKQVADAYNEMEKIIQERRLPIDLQPAFGGFPVILKKDDTSGEFVPKSGNIRQILQ